MSRFLSEAIIVLNDCGAAFWHTCVAMFLQVGVLVAILFLVDLALHRKIRAVFRYWMWSLVLLKLLLPVTLSTPASAAYWLTNYRPFRTAEPPALPEDSRPTNTPAELPAPIDPNSATAFNAPQTPDIANSIRRPPLLPVDPLTLPIQSAHVPAPVAAAPESAQAINQVVHREPLHATGWALLAWMTGVLIFAGLCVHRALYVRRLLRLAGPAPEHFVQILYESCALVGVKGHFVRLQISNELGSPAICGFWRPTILLPRHLLDTLDGDQFRLVFVHELTHWKRRDLQINCLQTLLQIIYFYNPFVWMANAMLRRLREQAVDEAVLVTLNSESKRYSSTLLDIAAMMRRPADLAVQLIGVVESRHLLAQRIRRIVERPIPTSARLGMTGLAALIIAGVVLLPMSGSDRSSAADEAAPAKSNTKTEPRATPLKKRALRAPTGSILSGKVVNDAGKPVTDATVEIVPNDGGRNLSAKADDEGSYVFPSIDKDGKYYIQVYSAQCVSIDQPDECPHVELSADRELVRDVTLQRACQLRIKTVDERGRPVEGVSVYAKCLGEVDGRTRDSMTGRQGIATIGVRPLDKDYLIATSSENFAFAKAIARANDPNVVVEQTLVQRVGVTVEGKAVCSDGEPPAGWRILALPDWWDFSSSPNGQEIADDGSFELPHIVSDSYNVKIYIVKANGGLTPRIVLKSHDISDLGKPLDLKCEFLSPASLVQIGGKLSVTGGEHEGFSIEAVAQNGNIDAYDSAYVRAGETKFRIEALVPGKFTLKVQHPEIEPIEMKDVDAPSEGVELKIKIVSKPKIRGVVTQKDTKQPFKNFRVRAIKIQTLRGADFAGNSHWTEFENPEGQFELEVVGPGIYVIEASAKGFATARSAEINTDKIGDVRTPLELSAGVNISGIVLNEDGQPVGGANVYRLSDAGTRGPRPWGTGGAKSDETVTGPDGRFVFEHLSAEVHMLGISHPDYAFANALTVVPNAGAAHEELKVKLTRGATIRGTVHDDAGLPLPQVALVFEPEGVYRTLADNDRDKLTAVSDANGNYQIDHVPDKFCTVYRSNQWQVTGVVRRAVLPENGKVHHVDFGGSHKTTGILMLNGQPYANAKLALCDESPGQGTFTAFTETADDGSFRFMGAGPGLYWLCHVVPGRTYPWMPISRIRMSADDIDLGTIARVLRKVTIDFPPTGEQPAADMRLSLSEYDPIWTGRREVGTLASHDEPDDPWVIENVPPGEYELTATVSRGRQVSQRVEVPADKPEVSVKFELPRGNASVRGKIDPAIAKDGGMISLKLRSTDGRIREYVRQNDAHEFAVENLPAGDYYLTEQDVRQPERLLEFSLAPDEVKTLDLTPAVIKQPVTVRGFRVVRVYTEEGVALTGAFVKLDGSGRAGPHSIQYNRQSIVGPPGQYQITVSFPGFESYHGPLELFVRDANGNYPPTLEVSIKLQALLR